MNSVISGSCFSSTVYRAVKTNACLVSGLGRIFLVACLLFARPAWAEGYQTPIAGQAFETTFAGKHIEVPAENRRSVTAWDAGIAVTPGLSKNEFLPIGSLYLWRRPDESQFLRATIAGVFNEIFYAYSPQSGGLEYIATLENFTVPFDQAEFVDGNRIEQEELTWGYVRAGVGVGWRGQTQPGYQDNMRSVSLAIEPGYFYFSRGNSVADDFVTPESTPEIRLHTRLRWDALERNLLELAHQGFATGADFVAAHRSDWDSWGRNGEESGSGHQQYGFASAYLRTASGVPGALANEKHRVLTALHAGVGNNLDRFSAPRLGGAPQADEYGALARAGIPGALVREFYPNHYAIATGEYRYEATFFSYVGLRGSVTYLDRNRLHNGDIQRDNDVLGSVGVRLTTGFFFETRLQMEYNYNSGVIRNSDEGGHNVVLHLSAGI